MLSLDPTSLLLGGVVLLCVLWWLSTRRPPGLPPGPGPALPLLGHLHLLAKDPRPQFWAWRRQYGDVFSLYMGGRLVVVLASYSAIREALVTLADVFSGRPHIFLTDKLTQNKGIMSTSGKTWKEQRKTSLEILRQMGMGKNVLAEKIQEEITHYIRAIKDHQGAPVDLARMTQITISNNICSIVFGQRFDYEDEQFINYIERLEKNFKLLGGTSILNFIPALRYIPGDLFKMEELISNVQPILEFLDEHISAHQRTLDEQKEEIGEDTDFTFSYLLQMRKHRAKGDADTSLNEENLRVCMADLFFAGTETTSTALLWAMLFFLHHPEVQDKCFQEIVDVIGPHRPPTIRDRPILPYVEATISEVLRKGDIAPLTLWHGVDGDVTFRGYVIPHDAVVLPAVTCVMQDADVWEDPDNFLPERFIDADGKLKRPAELIPFNIGRRVCLGESLARMELFLYLATLIQHFRFLPPEDGQLPSLEGVFGMSHVPQPYKIRAVPRF